MKRWGGCLVGISFAFIRLLMVLRGGTGKPTMHVQFIDINMYILMNRNTNIVFFLSFFITGTQSVKRMHIMIRKNKVAKQE